MRLRSDVRTFVDDIDLKNVWKIFYVAVQKRMLELQKKFEKKSEKKKVREKKSSKRKGFELQKRSKK
jgi:hypothetical protein